MKENDNMKAAGYFPPQLLGFNKYLISSQLQFLLS